MCTTAAGCRYTLPIPALASKIYQTKPAFSPFIRCIYAASSHPFAAYNTNTYPALTRSIIIMPSVWHPPPASAPDERPSKRRRDSRRPQVCIHKYMFRYSDIVRIVIGGLSEYYYTLQCCVVRVNEKKKCPYLTDVIKYLKLRSRHTHARGSVVTFKKIMYVHYSFIVTMSI